MSNLRADARMVLARYESSVAAFGMEAGFPMKDVRVVQEYIEKLEAAVGGAYSWIDRWAKHVPNCRAPMRPCTCGRDAVMYEASKALENFNG